MPVQQQTSSLAKRLGGRLAEANEEHKDKPVDTGNRRLPAGIRDGVAKLNALYWKEYEDDKSGLKGQLFFRASAIVVSPVEYNGEKVAGMVTFVIVPLCDVPAKGQRKESTFAENWGEFQNIIRLLGIAPCPETKQTDPSGVKTEAYFLGAMQQLTDPIRAKVNPVYVSFSTRGWTPPATPQQPKPTEMVFETWHGLAEWSGRPDPAAGVTESSQPSSMLPPPQTASQRGSAPPSTNGPPPQSQPFGADLVTTLVETAMNDPEGATEEGIAAAGQLENLAWERGWTREQTTKAKDWVQVGEMALNPSTSPASPATVTVGSRWLFAKRGQHGAKLKDGKGVEFPPLPVEVATVDTTNKTCTVRSAKDSKDIIDIRTKQSYVVKFEWLEQDIPF